MVVVDPIEGFHMQGQPGVHGEGLEELPHQLGVEFADLGRVELGPEHEEGPAGDVHGHPGQGLVHGQMHIGVAGDALHVAERLADRLAQRDAHILHRVVEIDVQVAFGLNFQVDEGVARDLVEHVVKKAHARGDLGLARAIERDLDLYVGFPRLARKGGVAHESFPVALGF